jgi:nucleotide-binding universal stress UspA family protein
MPKFSSVLVALDMSGMDEILLRYVRFFTFKVEAKKAYFLHVVPDFTIPENLEVEFQKKFAPEVPLDEIVARRIREEVTTAFAEAQHLAYEIEVVEGRPFEQLLHMIEVKDVGLVIVGKKEMSNGSGITAKRIARQVKKANVLFVPQDAAHELNKVMVPIDFSDNAARALQTALDMRRHCPGLEITAAYVVDFPPSGYYLTQKEYHSFNQMLLDTARASFAEFLTKYNLRHEHIEFHILENAWHNIAGAIIDFAQLGKFSMVVIGAQGHSAFESLVFGSITEKVVARIGKVPLLIVR